MLAGGRPVVRRRRVVTALAWGVPGLVAGAAVVGRISRADLQVAVGIAVVVAVLLRAWHPGVVAEGRAARSRGRSRG